MGRSVSIDVIFGINVEGDEAKELYQKIKQLINEDDARYTNLIPDNESNNCERYYAYINQVDGRGNNCYNDYQWFTLGIFLCDEWDNMKEKVEDYLTITSLQKAQDLWNKYIAPYTDKKPHILMVGTYD